MSDDPKKLRVLYTGEQAMPEWAPEEVTDLQDKLAAALKDSEVIILISLERDPADGKLFARHNRTYRGPRTSHYEQVGVLSCVLHSWQEE